MAYGPGRAAGAPEPRAWRDPVPAQSCCTAPRRRARPDPRR